jgi:hypothetical protein
MNTFGGAYAGLPLNSVWGKYLGRKWMGVKGIKRFSVHFNAVVGAYMKGYGNKYQTTAGLSLLG